MKKVLIITNNPKVRELDGALYFEESLMDILRRVRDYVHKGHVLISHPLAGSVKPNETPYKSVILEIEPDAGVDEKSLHIIDGSNELSDKFLKDRPLPSRAFQFSDDYALIDFSLIESGLQSLSHL